MLNSSPYTSVTMSNYLYQITLQNPSNRNNMTSAQTKASTVHCNKQHINYRQITMGTFTQISTHVKLFTAVKNDLFDL